MNVDNPAESKLPCPKVEWVHEPLMREYIKLMSEPNTQIAHVGHNPYEYFVSDEQKKFKVLIMDKAADPRNPDSVLLMQKLTNESDQVDRYDHQRRTGTNYETKASRVEASYSGDPLHVSYMTGLMKDGRGKDVKYFSTFNDSGNRNEFAIWTDDGFVHTECVEK